MHQPEPGSSSCVEEPINPVLIVGGVAGLVILLVASVVGFRAYKRKQEAEFEAMMNEGAEGDIEEASEEAEPEEQEPVDYGAMTVPELKELLQERDLVVSGVKAELVSRLEEDDVQLEKFKARLGHVEGAADVMEDDDDEDLLEGLELDDEEDDDEDLLEGLELDDEEEFELDDEEEFELDDEEVVAETDEAIEEIDDDEFEEFEEELSEDEFDEFEEANEELEEELSEEEFDEFEEANEELEEELSEEEFDEFDEFDDV